MHELSIAQELAEIIFKTLENNDKKNGKVSRIKIIIGETSGIDQEFLEHSLKEHIFKGTSCENAILEFCIEKIKIKCLSCGKEFTEPIFECDCGNKDFDIISGRDVYVSEIEVE